MYGLFAAVFPLGYPHVKVRKQIHAKSMQNPRRFSCTCFLSVFTQPCLGLCVSGDCITFGCAFVHECAQALAGTCSHVDRTRNLDGSENKMKHKRQSPVFSGRNVEAVFRGRLRWQRAVFLPSWKTHLFYRPTKRE